MAQSPRGASFTLATSASHLLHRAQQLAADRFAQLAGDRATLRQFAVLAAIAEKPGRSQTDLVSATGIDRSTLADMITRMERRGWIIRVTAANDARANAVTLAAPGRATFTACIPFARAADDAVLEALPRGDRKTLMDLLGVLSAAADQSAARAARPAKKAPPKRPPPPPPKKGARPAKKKKKGRR
ncbi:MAG: MarR family transcriptional regulator [Alphaproteobacteria bacterium]|nr:MarR family transcriptional regulator [Alphaproteobacteria bacterium]